MMRLGRVHECLKIQLTPISGTSCFETTCWETGTWPHVLLSHKRPTYVALRAGTSPMFRCKRRTLMIAQALHHVLHWDSFHHLILDEIHWVCLQDTKGTSCFCGCVTASSTHYRTPYHHHETRSAALSASHGHIGLQISGSGIFEQISFNARNNVHMQCMRQTWCKPCSASVQKMCFHAASLLLVG